MHTVGDGEDGVRARDRGRDRDRVAKLGLDDLDALGGEGLCLVAVGVAGDGADLELARERRIGEDDLDDGSALVSGGAKDGEKLGGHCNRDAGWLKCLVLGCCLLEVSLRGPAVLL